jgi:hypothetical protein
MKVVKCTRSGNCRNIMSSVLINVKSEAKLCSR